MEPVKVFYSYSHQDAKLRNELSNHLASMKNNGVLVDWYDAEISLGTDWDDSIKKQMRLADYVLLLVSSDFLASKYIRSVELKEVMAPSRQGLPRVVPIILRPCEFSEELFYGLQGLPSGMKAVTKWETLDDGFVDVAQGLKKEFDKFRKALGSPVVAPPPVVLPTPVDPPASVGAPPILPSPAPGENPAALPVAAPPTPSILNGAGRGGGFDQNFLQAKENNRALATTSKEAFRGLSQLMENPRIKMFVTEQASELMEVDQALQTLVAYKDVHDRLHDLQFLCYNYLFQEAKKAEDQVDWPLLEKPRTDLQEILVSLGKAAKQESLAEENFDWLEQLTTASKDLDSACDELTLPPLIKSSQAIKLILETRPTVFDTKLCAAAKTLPLQDLGQALQTIRTKLSAASLSSDAGKLFDQGMEAFPGLSASLQALTTEHTRWQVIAARLWSINALIDRDINELKRNWGQLRDRLNKICVGNSSAWAVSIVEKSGKLEDILKQEPPPDAADAKERRRWEIRVRQSYQSCANEAETRFYQADVSLLELCNQLRGIHHALGQLLESLP